MIDDYWDNEDPEVELTPGFCKECGTPIKDGVVLCESCEEELDDEWAQ